MKVDQVRLAALVHGLLVYAADAAVWPMFDATALENGQTAVIPNWELASSSTTSRNASELSIVGNGISEQWHLVPVSRCTVVGCLHAAGVSPWDDLGTVFRSNNLASLLDKGDITFSNAWLYRREFIMSSKKGRHFFLETHGITSGADIFLNGKQVATRNTQAGSFGGHTYDITPTISDVNTLLVKAYPTNYNYDFAQGFVDWNPYPPDNGTGIWRNITLKQTGPVILSPMGVQTRFSGPKMFKANVTLRTTARNLENRTVAVDVAAQLVDIWLYKMILNMTQQINLPPYATHEISITKEIDTPPVWWPRQWGKQKLVKAQLNATVNNVLSDSHRNTIGLREVSSELNEHGDLVFYVNRQAFQVLGAGYSPDLFLRWDSARFRRICEYVLDIGMNTIRLEGKMEQPELYEIADRLGIMVLPGWECCDKWEAWSYNDELSVSPVPFWKPTDYTTAGTNMEHEASMLQIHPSVLGFMVGSDFYPDDNATAIYVEALKKAGWQTPIISSGSQRGYPALLGQSGMKMDGPYDWVPPNYWWDTEPASTERYGAAFGFGSELGAGVGTPEIGSLSKFLTQEEIDNLWQKPNVSFYHNGIGKTFSSRKIYNEALSARYGAPTSSADYLEKAQMMDYEATRAQFEAYAAKWSAARPATGMIYWMLNNAWPSLHWNLFDYYLRQAGSYFGAKAGIGLEHVAYDYRRKQVYLINRSGFSEYGDPPSGLRTVLVEAIDMNGKTILNTTVETKENRNSSEVVLRKKELHGLKKIKDVAFFRLKLFKNKSELLSRNVYWLTKKTDKLAWGDSEWYYTPVKKYADYTALNRLPRANMTVTARRIPDHARILPKLRNGVNITLANHSPVPGFFVRLNLVNEREGRGELKWEDVVPVEWEDNYVTLWPHETMVLIAAVMTDVRARYLQVDGKNVDTPEVVEIIDE